MSGPVDFDILAREIGAHACKQIIARELIAYDQAETREEELAALRKLANVKAALAQFSRV